MVIECVTEMTEYSMPCGGVHFLLITTLPNALFNLVLKKFVPKVRLHIEIKLCSANSSISDARFALRYLFIYFTSLNLYLASLDVSSLLTITKPSN